MKHASYFVKNKSKIREQEGESGGWVGVLIEYLDLPFNYLRKYTIPPCNPEEYEHHYLVFWPLLGILFVLWSMFETPQVWWLYTIPLSVVLMLLFYRTKPEKKHGVPSYFLYIDLLGIACGLLWTKVACGILIDLLTFAGVLFNLQTTYLGLTIIAVGNALPDGLTTIAIAKQGQAIMGITGGYAGQLFGLLIGFGIAMFKRTMTTGPLEFDLFNPAKLEENFLDLVVVGVALLTMVYTFTFGLLNRYKYTKSFGIGLAVIYVVFIIFCTFIAVRQAIK